MSVNIARVYRFSFGGVALALMISAAPNLSLAEIQEVERQNSVRDEFSRRYEAWQKYRLTFPGVVVAGLAGTVGEEFDALKALGVSALPLFMEELKKEPIEFGDHPVYEGLEVYTDAYGLLQAFMAVSKKQFTKAERTKSGTQSPNTLCALYITWWEEGCAGGFFTVCNRWRVLKQQGTASDEVLDDAKKEMLRTGVVAVPCIMEEIKRGELGLVTILWRLTDGAVPADASKEVCLGWWENNQHHWAWMEDLRKKRREAQD